VKRNMIIALLVGFLLGIASQHQSGKVVRANVVGPAFADTAQAATTGAQRFTEAAQRNRTRGFVALGACASNGAYNAPGMLYQCVSDYWSMRWGTPRVDDSCVRYVFAHGTPRDVGRLLHSGQVSC
jgi:hypothetical protein